MKRKGNNIRKIERFTYMCIMVAVDCQGEYGILSVFSGTKNLLLRTDRRWNLRESKSNSFITLGWGRGLGL